MNQDHIYIIQIYLSCDPLYETIIELNNLNKTGMYRLSVQSVYLAQGHPNPNQIEIKSQDAENCQFNVTTVSKYNFKDSSPTN